MNKQQLRKAAPGISSALADMWLPNLNLEMEYRAIDTPKRQACFVAQVLWETTLLTKFVEDLTYRPQTLMAQFRGRFTPQEAAEFGYIPGRQKADQRMIANIAYANRYGNGDRHSDDGFNFRGRGPFHLTFKDNYIACGLDIDVDLISSPEMLLQPDVGCKSAGWYWHKGNPTGRSLNSLADAYKVELICKAINGGSNGLQQRIDLTNALLRELS